MKLACALLLLSSGVAEAQPGHTLDPGSRLRVSILVPADIDSTGFHSRDRKIGSLLRYDNTSLRIDPGPPAIPWAAVSRLEISDGRHGNAGKGVLYGALIGLVAGVVIGVTIGQDENGGEGNEDLAAEGGIALGVAGLLGGAGIGAIVGGRIKTDDWREVPVGSPAGANPAGAKP